MAELELPPLHPGTADLWAALRPAGACPVAEPHPEPRTHWMFGDGPTPAVGMIIGDGPNGAEDRAGRPLLPDFLRERLVEVGIREDQIYYTYATKCAVPKERRDKFTEATYRDYQEALFEEIRRVQPKAVLVMGSTAFKSVMGGTGITKNRGQEKKSDELDCWFVPTVASGYVEKKPNFLEAFMADLSKFARRMAGVEVDSSVEVVWCNTVDEVRAALLELDQAPGEVVSMDLESKNYYDYFPTSRIWCMGLSKDPAKGYMIPLEHPESPFVNGLIGESGMELPWPEPRAAKKDPLCQAWLKKTWQETAKPELHEVWEVLREWFSRNGDRPLELRKVNGHNLKYDGRHCARRGIRFNLYFDTMVSAHLLNENRNLALLDRMVTEFGFENWGKKKISFDPPSPLADMGTYCAIDTAHSHRCYLKDKEELAQHQRIARLFKLAVLPGMDALLDMELNGFYVDMDVLEVRLREAQDKIVEIEEKLLEYVHEDLKTGEINFSSTPFLGKWLFSEEPLGLGLKPLKKTAKGKPSVDAESLDSFAGVHPATDLLLERRKAEKAVSFLEKWKELAGPDNRIHPFYNLTGTVTGRRSCSKPNLQQVPREGTHEGLRSCLGSQPGWTLVEADYSQIELRIAAMESRDPVMLKAYELGRDLHGLTAAMVTGRLFELQEERGVGDIDIIELLEDTSFFKELESRITKEERRMAKAVNFGFLYGMGWRKFGIYAATTYGVTVTDDQAKEFREKFFLLYEGLVAWHKQRRKEVRANLKVSSLIGRERHLPMILSSDEGIAAQAERQAINSPVQGFGGDLALLSYGILNPMFRAHELETGERTAMIVGDVHDAVFYELRNDMVEYWLPIIKRTMENLPTEKFGFTPDIPIVTEPAIGTHWGKLEEWHEPIAA